MQCPNLEVLPQSPSGKTGWPWTESGNNQIEQSDIKPWPRISVVSPSFNQWLYLEEAIRSVLLQGYPDIEFIIHDGGSDLKVIEILEKYEPWLTYWVSEPDRGQSHAINKGIQRSTGEIIFWLNTDDICLPDAFFKVARAFIKNPAVKIVSGQARLINSESQVTGALRSYFVNWEEIVTNPGNSLRQVSTFFSRDLFDEAGLLDENPNLAMDTDLLVRFTKNHTPFVLDDYIAAFRTHADANTQRMLIRWYEENDRTRVKYLQSIELLKKYRERSSRNWLTLSKRQDWTKNQRVRCLKNAVKNKRSILISRNLLSSIRKLF